MPAELWSWMVANSIPVFIVFGIIIPALLIWDSQNPRLPIPRELGIAGALFVLSCIFLLVAEGGASELFTRIAAAGLSAALVTPIVVYLLRNQG